MSVLETQFQELRTIEPRQIRGRVESVRGLMVRVTDFPAPVDSAVEIQSGSTRIPGQVVGFDGGQAMVMSLGRLEGISPGDCVEMTQYGAALAHPTC